MQYDTMNISFKEIEIHRTKIMQTYGQHLRRSEYLQKKNSSAIYNYKILIKIIQYDEYFVLKNYSGSNKSERCWNIAFLREDQHAQRCAYSYESFNCFFAKDENSVAIFNHSLFASERQSEKRRSQKRRNVASRCRASWRDDKIVLYSSSDHVA